LIQFAPVPLHILNDGQLHTTDSLGLTTLTGISLIVGIALFAWERYERRREHRSDDFTHLNELCHLDAR
jgi:hypothetical protein